MNWKDNNNNNNNNNNSNNNINNNNKLYNLWGKSAELTCINCCDEMH